jgi:hypothetical protein
MLKHNPASASSAAAVDPALPTSQPEITPVRAPLRVVSAEMRQIVARWRSERPGYDARSDARNAAAQQYAAPDAVPLAKPIRCKNRNEQWHCEAYRAAAEMRRRHLGQTEEIDAALAEALAEGPDWARCHRGSLFMDPPKNNLDRNHIARIWFVAQMIERKSWACRKKYAHGGTLGVVALDLLRTLLFIIKKQDGKLYPSYEALAMLTRKSRQAIITAMQVLERMGFVTVHRRIKRVMTPLGPKMVQDSNAYEFHLPVRGLGQLAMSIFCPPSSEYSKSAARSLNRQQQEESKANKGQPIEKVDRWWLLEPLPTGNGGYR